MWVTKVVFVAVIVKFTDTASYIKWLLWKLPLVRRDTKKKMVLNLAKGIRAPDSSFILFFFSLTPGMALEIISLCSFVDLF
jgi:hypothetical protein